MIPKLGVARRAFPTSGILRVQAMARSGPRAFAAAITMLAAQGLQPALAADPGRGAPLYEKHCALCHGARGGPVWPGTPDFRRRDVLMKPDGQLLGVIRKGRGVMPGYLGVMKEGELLDLLAYLRTLS